MKKWMKRVILWASLFGIVWMVSSGYKKPLAPNLSNSVSEVRGVNNTDDAKAVEAESAHSDKPDYESEFTVAFYSQRVSGKCYFGPDRGVQFLDAGRAEMLATIKRSETWRRENPGKKILSVSITEAVESDRPWYQCVVTLSIDHAHAASQ